MPSSRAARIVSIASARVELVEIGDGVELVQVERVAVQELQRLLELCPDPVAVVAERLAADEQAVPDRRDERPEELLGPPVLGGHVEVVDPGVQGRLEGLPRLLGGRPPEGGAPQDGHG
jgi:hypothetical protein